MHYDCLIVGGGHGGAQTAIALRQSGFEGSIGILTNESDAPYERPPLTKDYLLGGKAFAEMALRPPHFWLQRQIDVLLGRHVESVDGAAHQVRCAERRTFTYGHLVWAAGGVPRRLDCVGGHARGVFTIRSRADVDAIRNQLERSGSIAIVGGGFIGLEAAAALRSLGKSVVVLEAANRLLARACGQTVSDFYCAEHRRNGVEVRLGAQVEAIETASDEARAVRLADGTRIATDMVLVGIGIIPSVAPLLAAGAAGDFGVEVDDYCRTSLADVYAVGDCATHPNPYAGGRMIRLESVQNATDQATIVAKTIAGGATLHRSVPWFWSKQYDLMLQTIGLALNYDNVVVRGDPASRKFSAVYVQDGRVCALDCVNSTADFVQGRNLVNSRGRVDIKRLADPAVKLRSLLSAA